MGSTKLRRLLKTEGKWTDKEAHRHKHDYSEHWIADVTTPIGKEYYDVMKCKECKSFLSIPKEGAVTGLILEEELTEEMQRLPRMYFKKKAYIIGFSSLEVI